MYVVCFVLILAHFISHTYIVGAAGCNVGTAYIADNTLTCYWVISSSQSFNDSLAKCQINHGSLAIIPDQQALDFVNTLKGDTSEYYVGYKVVNFKLVRLDGVIQTWAPWKSGEPTGTGDCVSSFNIDGTFWDEKCTTPYQALCQYPGFSPIPLETTTAAPELTTEVATEQITEVVTEQVTEVVTQHVTELPTETSSCPISSCVYVCKNVDSELNITDEVKKEIAKNVSKELQVNKETLSSTIRSKTSAKDDRPSAAGIGYVGAVILSVIFGGILVLDAPVFAEIFKHKFKRVKSLWTKCKK